MSTKTKKANPLLRVQICEAKPNPLFTEAQRQSIRFLRFNRHVPCAECGKKVRIHITMLCEFRCGDMERSMFVLKFSDKKHAPLTPVCGDHPLKPAW